MRHGYSQEVKGERERKRERGGRERERGGEGREREGGEGRERERGNSVKFDFLFLSQTDLSGSGPSSRGGAYKIYSDIINMVKYCSKMGSECKPLLILW